MNIMEALVYGWHQLNPKKTIARILDINFQRITQQEPINWCREHVVCSVGHISFHVPLKAGSQTCLECKYLNQWQYLLLEKTYWKSLKLLKLSKNSLTSNKLQTLDM